MRNDERRADTDQRLQLRQIAVAGVRKRNVGALTMRQQLAQLVDAERPHRKQRAKAQR